MYLPSPKQLQYFLAVLEVRHFGHAAERCFVTQSTLSTGIQELENLLGAKLFERDKRKVLPTPLGLTLEPVAREILDLSTHFVDVAKGEQKPLSGTLRLGVIPTIGPFLLPRVLPKIRRRFPELKLMLVEDQTATLIERINRGDLDCAIIALPYALGNLQHAIFFSENFWVAFPKNHPLAEAGPVESVELPEDELLLLEEGHCLRDHVLSACHRPALKQRAAFQGTSLYTLMEMVAGGQGITFLPEMAIDSSMVKQKDFKLRPLAEKGPHRDIGLIWRKGYARQNDMQLLQQAMGEILQKQK